MQNTLKCRNRSERDKTRYKNNTSLKIKKMREETNDMTEDGLKKKINEIQKHYFPENKTQNLPVT